MNHHYEIIEILRDVVSAVSADCRIVFTHYPSGEIEEMNTPEISYIFGSGEYVKDELDVYSKAVDTSEAKLPLIALFLPIQEDRTDSEFYTKASVRILIACSTAVEYSNEQRLVYSFRNILRPIYRRFLEVLSEDSRLFLGADEHIPHNYSENYDYGKYGAFAQSGEKVSEPIDAINITNLQLTIKNPTCR